VTPGLPSSAHAGGSPQCNPPLGRSRATRPPRLNFS
jgi:hypothetical protein